MSFDWRAKRDAAILNRRRVGAEDRRASGGGGGWYISRPTQSVHPSYWFYYRWAYDNVIEMLARADTDSEGQLASDLYDTLITYGSHLNEYQREVYQMQFGLGPDQMELEL